MKALKVTLEAYLDIETVGQSSSLSIPQYLAYVDNQAPRARHDWHIGFQMPKIILTWLSSKP